MTRHFHLAERTGMNNDAGKTKPTDSDWVEIDLSDLSKSIWKNKKLIFWIVGGLTFAVLVASLFMTNIYTARAVLKPVSQTQSSGRAASLMAQFGGIANLAGIAMPGAASSTEMVNLLKSNVLKKSIIERHNLLPVLFPKRWDEEKQAWKKPGLSLNPLFYLAKLKPADPSASKKEPGVPDIWDGIRALDRMTKINYNTKEDIITVSVDFRDAQMAAKIADYFILALNDHMSGEAKRIANINKAYLENQLRQTSDPLVQQKIYTLIAEKIETMMMAEVKEGYAFKVLDPPMTPDRKSRPKRSQMVVVAFLVSLVIAVFVVLIRERAKKNAGGENAK